MEQRKEDLVDAEVQLPPGRILDLYRSGVSWWNITNILSSEPGAPRRAYVNAHVHAIITGSQYEHTAWMQFVRKLWGN
jgi:hypothetical protein